MLLVFFGTDEQQTRAAAFAALEKERERDLGLTINRLEPETYEPGQLASLSAMVSLFGGASAYIIDTPSLLPEFYEEFIAQIEDLANSTQLFVLIERPLLAAELKKITTHATAITEYKKESTQTFATFSMADALARKDKRSLWLLLQEAGRSGLGAEEIIGVLWWQLKTMRLAAGTKNALEAGIKDYPYNKAKKALANFKPKEIEALSLSLLTLYHEGHAGKRDIDLALEEWALRL